MIDTGQYTVQRIVCTSDHSAIEKHFTFDRFYYSCKIFYFCILFCKYNIKVAILMFIVTRFHFANDDAPKCLDILVFNFWPPKHFAVRNKSLLRPSDIVICSRSTTQTRESPAAGLGRLSVQRNRADGGNILQFKIKNSAFSKVRALF